MVFFSKFPDSTEPLEYLNQNIKIDQKYPYNMGIDNPSF